MGGFRRAAGAVVAAAATALTMLVPAAATHADTLPSYTLDLITPALIGPNGCTGPYQLVVKTNGAEVPLTKTLKVALATPFGGFLSKEPTCTKRLGAAAVIKARSSRASFYASLPRGHAAIDATLAPLPTQRFHVDVLLPAAHQTLAVVLYTFPDPVWANNLPFTSQEANDMTFGAAPSVSSFYADNSRGTVDITGSVSNWVTMPAPMKTYCPDTSATSNPPNQGFSCNLDLIAHDAAAAARANGFTAVDTADKLAFVGNGMGQVGDTTGDLVMHISAQQAVWQAGPLGYVSVFAHEFGHALYLEHASLLDCSNAWATAALNPVSASGCYANRYGDPVDVMGAGNAHEFNAVHKEELGFLSDANRVYAKATPNTTTTYVLDPTEFASNGVQVVHIPLRVGFTTNYFVEYRKPVGNYDSTTLPGEKALVAGAYVGLQLGTGSSWSGDGDTLRVHSGNTYALTPSGPMFTDPYRHITIRALQFLNNGAQIQIQVIRG